MSKSVDYKSKYYKYKAKYMKLLNELEDGVYSSGFFRKDNEQYRVFRTDENKIFSFKEVSIEDVDKSEFTTEVKRPKRGKILYIDSLKTFDEFTNKYGQPGKVDYLFHHIYIQWDRVAKRYKGFYLNKDNKELYMQRHAKALLRKKFRLNSWWPREYEKMTHRVMIFE